MLAHELRNPLAPIRNAVEVDALAGDDPAAVTRAADVINRQVQQMSRIVDDLIDVCRIAGQDRRCAQSGSRCRGRGAGGRACRPLIEARGHELTIALPRRAGLPRRGPGPAVTGLRTS